MVTLIREIQRQADFMCKCTLSLGKMYCISIIGVSCSANISMGEHFYLLCFSGVYEPQWLPYIYILLSIASLSRFCQNDFHEFPEIVHFYHGPPQNNSFWFLSILSDISWQRKGRSKKMWNIRKEVEAIKFHLIDSLFWTPMNLFGLSSQKDSQKI